MPPVPDLLLVGGGHAHVDVVRSFAAGAWPAVRVTLISPAPVQYYSGMVPGYVGGRYEIDDVTIDLASLCRAAGVRFLMARAERVDTRSCLVSTDEGEISFTHLSLDVGSSLRGLEVPGVREHALPLRPMSEGVTLRDRCDALASRGGSVQVVVVGAGAAGFEVALAIQRRLSDRGARPRVLLLERGETLLPGYPSRVRKLALRTLGRADIEIRTSGEVAAVTARSVRVEGGEEIPSDLTVWATGAAPPPLLAASRLPLSAAGYLSVREDLRVTDGAPVWGAGDCIDLEGRELPKAGVHAVRQAPVLAANLKSALSGTDGRRYRAQDDFLSLLNTADGAAILHWGQVVLHGRAAWWLKNRIDRRFLARYRPEALPSRQSA